VSSDKRDGERLAILGELQGAATIAQPLSVKELSRGGAQIEASYPLQLNSLHEFKLMLGDRPIVVKGRVVHCQVTDINGDHVVYRSGIQFIDPPDWASQAITQFLEDVRAGRRG
jgi:hypothetical protein